MTDWAFRFHMHFWGDYYHSKSSHAGRFGNQGREVGFNDFVYSSSSEKFFPLVSVIAVASPAREIGAI